MGGFASLLGHAASGYNAAHEADTQRQFADLASRRAMAGEILSQIALDPNQHSEVRNLALQGRLGLSQEKPTADFNTKKYFDPLLTMMAKYRQPQGQQGGLAGQPPAPPPGLGIQGVTPVNANAPALEAQGAPPSRIPEIAQQPASIPAPQLSREAQPQGVGRTPYTPQMSAPPPPPADIAQAGTSGGLLAGVPEIAQNAATMAAAQAGGQETGSLQAKLHIMGPAIQKILADNPAYKNDPIVGPALAMASVGLQAPYGIYRSGMAGKSANGTVGQALADPEWAHLVPDNLRTGDPNQTIQLVRDNGGRPMSVTSELIPSMVPKTTAGSTTSAGGLTTTTKKTVTPQLGNIPTQSTGGAAPAKAKAATSGHAIPPAVSAAMDNIMMYGLPQGKGNDAQALALQEMKRQGIDPQIAVTTATRTMADKGRMILPLIDRARQLIASDPAALGPLAGRWSELQNKVGNLKGAPKELAGTLTSIYSMAGGLHGWRAIQVAERFKDTYGDLSNTPASLLSGLDAMQNTAQTAIKTAYPGMTNPPAPPAAATPAFNWEDHPVIK